MEVDWDKVLSNAGQAALGKLNSHLPLVANAVKTQTAAMVENGKFIERNKHSMTAAEYDMVKRIYTLAAASVFQSFEAIGIVAAQQAAEAAWNVIATALKTAAGISFI
jgi:hypothetical protein